MQIRKSQLRNPRTRTVRQFGLAGALAIVVTALIAPPTAAWTHVGMDDTFGQGGFARSILGTNEAHGVDFLPDGRILTARSHVTFCDVESFSVERFTANGLPDTSFSGDGAVVTPIQRGAEARDVASLRDGKVLAVGAPVCTNAGMSTRGFHLVRYLPNGSLDATFGSGGRKVIAAVGGTLGLLGTPLWGAKAVVLQPDGKVVVAGEAGTRPAQGVAVIRLLPSGALDTTFGKNGVVTSTLGGATRTHSVALQSDGRIVVGATNGASTLTASRHVLIRFTPAGAVDSSFGAGGVVQGTEIGSTSRAWQAMPNRDFAITADDRILVPGRRPLVYPTGQIGGYVPSVARFTRSGALDASFGVGGIAEVPEHGDGVAAAPRPDGTTLAIVNAARSGYTEKYFFILGADGRVLGSQLLFGIFGEQGSLHALAQPGGRLLLAGPLYAFEGERRPTSVARLVITDVPE